jgi:hypothetical protein
VIAAPNKRCFAAKKSNALNFVKIREGARRRYYLLPYQPMKENPEVKILSLIGKRNLTGG